MPSGAIKGPGAEEIWKRAKDIISQEYPGTEKSDPNKYYALVMTVYKSICKKHGCTPAREEKMSHLLGRLELNEKVVDLTFEDAMEELFELAAENEGKLSRIDIGKELLDIGKNSAEYMKKALVILKGLGVKIVS